MSATGKRSSVGGREAGFTLIEMLVVIGILGLVTGLVFPAWMAPLHRVQLYEARAALIANLRTARADSVRGGGEVSLDLADDGRSYGWGSSPSVFLPAKVGHRRAPRAITFFADGSSSGGSLKDQSGHAAASALTVAGGSRRPGRRRRPDERTRQGSAARPGSVLVEAMVAVAVISLVLMLAVTYRAVGESTLRARAAEAARTAGLIAQSRLALVGGEIPLAPGETTGVDGDFTWRVDVAPAPEESSAMGPLLAVTASGARPARPPPTGRCCARCGWSRGGLGDDRGAPGTGDAGFTLVEMLVSLTLLALAAVMMLEGLGSGQRLWAGETARIARGETVQAAQAMLRARIERLRPPRGSTPTPSPISTAADA